MLQKLGFAPGFNKQVTETGAEGQWFDGDNVRFRYGSPEKIGGWEQLGGDKLTGAGRAIHNWNNNINEKYSAIGTNRILYVYSEGAFYDIHPIRVTITGADFTSTSGSATVTVTASSAVHGLEENDIVLFDAVSGLSGSTFTDATFEDQKFMVTSVVSSNSFTITMATTEAGTALTNAGSASILCYYSVGPSIQQSGFGWGTGLYGGIVTGVATTTLATALTNTIGTTVVLTSSAAFPATGTIQIGTEFITYTANDTGTGTLTGGARGANGSTAATHSAGAAITNVSNYNGWGQASSSNQYTLNPGLWVLDNYGTKLIALIYNGECFEWDAAPNNAVSTRATIISGAPTASRHVLVSTPDRHLVFFGTETVIGDKNTQDDMFIRFSSQEDINTYTIRAENTAGSQRLAAGSKIMSAIKGRDAIYVWTDTALFLMQFVGQPFTFSFQQAGTNCGLIGKNAAVEVDGSAYWMSENGFFNYDGQLRSMPCLVEDFVYSVDPGLGINTVPKDLFNAGVNNLFGEINWFYCSASSAVVDRVVTYNYLDSTSQRPIWTVGSLDRTAWQDSAVYDKPHATYYDATDNASYDVTGNTDGSTIYYEQETGTDQVNAGGVITAIQANILSGDFDITQKRSNSGQAVGTPDTRGDGEYIMRITRFIPDFIEQSGTTKVSFTTRNYPNSTPVTTNFDTTSATTFKSTRIRARSIALKVSNTGTDEKWKLGTFRLDIAPGGMR
jgi:hypothetical protein